ncbi:MAG: hypothetical protein M3065_14495 [Actinomycetota bacterium]|nr:hypothetical protein [Actinomycetota bacterium]
MSALPAYVEYGARPTSPGPFHCQQGTLRGFVLKAEQARLAALSHRAYTEPCGGSTRYSPWSEYVLLLLGGFQSVCATSAPFSGWGSVREVQASVWLPLIASTDDPLGPDRLVLAVPYILVDNPMSYLGGREVYGYAKTMGRFAPASGLAATVVVEAYGGDFGAGHQAGWHPLLEVSAAGGQGLGADSWVSILELLLDVAPGLLEHPELLAELLSGKPSQVFLKQFRDAQDGTRACFQEVLEAPVTVNGFSASRLPGAWQVVFHSLDSHPIVAELGLMTPQTAAAAFELTTDFVVEAGVAV